MANRSTILGLMLSEQPDAGDRLDALLNEAQAQPTAKLVANAANSVQTTKIRVPGRWIAPPNSGSSSGATPSSSSSTAPSAVNATALKSGGPPSLSLASNKAPLKSTKERLPAPMSRAPAVAGVKATKTQAPTPAPLSSTARPSPRSSCAPPGSASQGAAGSESGRFCVCDRFDDDPDQTFVRCTVGRGGCNGWVHASPACSGLSEDQLDDLVLSKKQPVRYVCRLCKPLKAAAVAAAPKSAKVSGAAGGGAGSDEWVPEKEKATPAKRMPTDRPSSLSSTRESLLKKISKGRR